MSGPLSFLPDATEAPATPRPSSRRPVTSRKYHVRLVSVDIERDMDATSAAHAAELAAEWLGIAVPTATWPTEIAVYSHEFDVEITFMVNRQLVPRYVPVKVEAK